MTDVASAAESNFESIPTPAMENVVSDDTGEIFLIGSEQRFTYAMGLERMRKLRVRTLGPAGQGD
jgi:hypothetical protein